MSSRLRFPLGAVLALCLPGVCLAAEPSENDLPQQGYALLKRYCYRCHGLEYRAGALNVLNRELLTTAPDKSHYLVAGDPAASMLWQRAGIEKDMPPQEERDRPSAPELDTLRRWIEAQAPFPSLATRPFLNELSVLTRIRDDLLKHDEADRRFLRYFTLVNLHNLGGQFDDRDLRLVRSGLSKLVNSLSWQESIAVPTVVDAEQTILCIDLRKLGWSSGRHWQEILRSYPYALKHDRATDPQLAAIAAEVYRLSDCDLPYVRADWFIASGSRPPLYHRLLDLPDTLEKLTELLKVDLAGDFRENRLLRGGVLQSGVSLQNRVIDRHPAAHGAFWITYDFRSPAQRDRRNIFQNPLGPTSADHPFAELAFEHDGGEMIFHLPNGLQGYFLTDAKGKRIDVGPTDVVVDSLKASGSQEITNGLSCMACHDQGLRRFADRLASYLGVFGDARRKAEQLLASPQTLERLMDEDQQRFTAALEQACGSFLRVPEGQANDTSPLTEPILFATKHFQKDLGPAECAAELGLAKVRPFPELFPRPHPLSLTPVYADVIKREQWQAPGRLLSTFQVVANALDCGTPFLMSRGEPSTDQPLNTNTSKSSGE